MKRLSLILVVLFAIAAPGAAQLQNAHRIDATASPADATAAIPGALFPEARERTMIAPHNTMNLYGESVSWIVLYQPPIWSDACANTAGTADPTVIFSTGACTSGLGSWTIASYSTFDAREAAYNALGANQKLTAVRWRAVGSNQIASNRYVLAYQTLFNFCL